MATVKDVPTTYEEAVETLARWHGEGDALGLEAFSFDDPERRTVRLLEVNDAFLSMGEAWPVTFGESAEFPFKTSVFLVSREDYEGLRSGRIELPAGWGRLADGQKVWPAA
jgi:hypothetical protein